MVAATSAAAQEVAKPVLGCSPLAVTGVKALDNWVMDAATGEPVEKQANPATELLLSVGRDRNRTAFVALFQDFAPRVKSYVMGLGLDDPSADDLVQDIMLTVWRRASQYDPAKASPSTWIFTIARNRRIDMFRRQKRPQLDPNDPLLVPDPEPAADGVLAAGQANEALRRAVATLPKEQSQLLRLAFFEDLSHSHIAERLDLPLGTVKSRLRLALGKLRVQLKDDA